MDLVQQSRSLRLCTLSNIHRDCGPCPTFMVTEIVDIVQHSWSLRLWTLYNTCVLASCDLFALCVRVCACVWVCVCVCVWRLQTFCKRPGLSEMGRHAINNLLLLLSLSRDFNCRSWMCVRACWQWILPALCSAGEEAGPILGGGGEGRRGGGLFRKVTAGCTLQRKNKDSSVVCDRPCRVRQLVVGV